MPARLYCPGCGRETPRRELEMYGGACEACEQAWSERVDAWRHGNHDAELDLLFGAAQEKPRVN